MEVRARAPGKIILAGEHVVVHGSAAVTASIDLCTYVTFSFPTGLDRDEKLTALGSRNFFLCPKKSGSHNSGEGFGSAVTASSCSNEADKRSKTVVPWLKFMDFRF